MLGNSNRLNSTAAARPLLIILAVLLLGALGSAQSEIVFVRGADTLSGPEMLEAGYTTVTMVNESDQSYELTLVRLRDGVTSEQFEEAVAAAEDGTGESIRAFMEVAEFHGGLGAVPPNVSASVGLVLIEGRYMAFSENYEGGVEAVAEFDVAGSNGAEMPDADLRVGMRDFAFDLADEIPAGEQLWRIVNDGEQLHHVMVFPIEPGTTLEEVADSLAAPGEPAFVIGPPVVTSGAVGIGVFNDVMVDLAAGSYGAICFVPDAETGMPHAALGMFDVFTVVGD